jgi:hypothetical protein
VLVVSLEETKHLRKKIEIFGQGFDKKTKTLGYSFGFPKYLLLVVLSAPIGRKNKPATPAGHS